MPAHKIIWHGFADSIAPKNVIKEMLVIIYAAIAMMIVLPFVIWYMDVTMKKKRYR